MVRIPETAGYKNPKNINLEVNMEFKKNQMVELYIDDI